MAEVVGVSLGVTDEAVANSEVQRLLDKTRQVKRESVEVEATLGRIASRVGRKALRFAGRTAIGFAASEVLSETFMEQEEEGAGYLKRYLTAGATGAVFGATAGGLHGAVIGASVNLAMTGLSDLKRLFTEQSKEVEKVKKGLADAAKKAVERDRQVLEQLQQQRDEFQLELAEIRSKASAEVQEIAWNTYIHS